MKDRLLKMLNQGHGVKKIVREEPFSLSSAKEDMPLYKMLKLSGYNKTASLENARISGCLHVTPQTGVMILGLNNSKQSSPKLRWSACNSGSTSDEIAGYLVQSGIPTFAYKGMTLEDYWLSIGASLMFPHEGRYLPPTSLVDDGGDATLLLLEGFHTRMEDAVNLPQILKTIPQIDRLGFVDKNSRETLARRSVIKAIREIQPDFFSNMMRDFKGVTEETTTGIARLRLLHEAGLLAFPAYDVNGSVIKSKFDNLYGSRESVLDSIQRSTRKMLAGKTAVVLGYGAVGKGVVQSLRAIGCNVIVTEIDPICALQALMEGYKVKTLEETLSYGDIYITTTGCCDVITMRHFRFMKNGVILANAGHFDSEIDAEDLLRFPTREVAPGVTEVSLADAHKIILLSEGRLVNLVNAEGHPSMVMSCSMSAQVFAQIHLYEDELDTENWIRRLPVEVDEFIAKMHVEFLGGKLTRLTYQQAEYLGVPQDGPYKTDSYTY